MQLTCSRSRVALTILAENALPFDSVGGRDVYSGRGVAVLFRLAGKTSGWCNHKRTSCRRETRDFVGTRRTSVIVEPSPSCHKHDMIGQRAPQSSCDVVTWDTLVVHGSPARKPNGALRQRAISEHASERTRRSRPCPPGRWQPTMSNLPNPVRRCRSRCH